MDYRIPRLSRCLITIIILNPHLNNLNRGDQKFAKCTYLYMLPMEENSHLFATASSERDRWGQGAVRSSHRSFEYIVDRKLAIAIPFDQLNYYIKFAHTEGQREIIMRLARMRCGCNSIVIVAGILNRIVYCD